jgi:hypothetical protein
MQWCASILRRCKLLVPQESLQVDLFVTNFNLPVPHSPGLSDAGSRATFDIPDASFSATPSTVIEVKGVSLNREDLIIAQSADDGFVDLSYYSGDYKEAGELGHEEHWLDLTNFDGDNDDRMPGESSLNCVLKKEGTIRRAITIKKRASRRIKSSPDRGVNSGSGGLTDLPIFPEETNEPLSSSIFPVGCPAGLKPENPGRHQTSARSMGKGDQLVEDSQDWRRRSTASLTSQGSGLQALVRETSEELELELGDQEMQDIKIMAEFARPGRPKLDLILRDEVVTAGGRIVVACEQIFHVISWLSESNSTKLVGRRH